MLDLRRGALVYIAVVTISALIALVLAITSAARPDTYDLLLALAFTVLLTLANLRPLHFAHKTKVSLGTSVLFAAVLLLDPALAIVIALIGVAAAQGIQREPAIQITFNTASIMLEVGAAALLLVLVDWQHGGFDLGTPAHLFGLAGTIAIMYLVNVTLVAGIIALQTGLPFTQVFRQSVSFGHAEDASQFVLGLLAAAMIDAHLWTLPLFLLPAAVLYRSMAQHIQLSEQTIDALEALADVVDLRDPYTANHSRRVAAYARELATETGLSPDDVDLIERAARVHDIGKLIVDQAVLGKHGRLDENEWKALKQHPVTGAEILSRFPQLALATSFVRHHHEAMDGSGYPDNLTGGDIPLGARIIAVADAFDAMASARPYRGALPRDVVLDQFRSGAGSQWDESIVEALFSLVEHERLAFPEDASTPQLYDRRGELIPLPAAL